MATLTIRNIPDEVKQALRERAARHGVSMEEEARRVLRSVTHHPPSDQTAAVIEVEPGVKPDNLYDAMRRLVDQHGGGFDLQIPPRRDIAGERTRFWWLEEPE
jgi:plasmid stability protein